MATITDTFVSLNGYDYITATFLSFYLSISLSFFLHFSDSRCVYLFSLFSLNLFFPSPIHGPHYPTPFAYPSHSSPTPSLTMSFPSPACQAPHAGRPSHPSGVLFLHREPVTKQLSSNNSEGIKNGRWWREATNVNCALLSEGILPISTHFQQSTSQRSQLFHCPLPPNASSMQCCIYLEGRSFLTWFWKVMTSWRTHLGKLVKSFLGPHNKRKDCRRFWFTGSTAVSLGKWVLIYICVAIFLLLLRYFLGLILSVMALVCLLG